MKLWLAKHAPWLGPVKRTVVAARDSLVARASYAQHGEDEFVLRYLASHGVDPTRSVYVDVGANHPTDISNTFLLYKNGYSGIIVEPNQELCRLFRRFRTRDTVFNIGCSNEASVLRFNVSNTPVLSSFLQDWRAADVYDHYYVPILKLDDALKHMTSFSYISFLSIDVEGLNTEVLEGSMETLHRTLLLCVEFDKEADIGRYNRMVPATFVFERMIGCNAIYVNTSMLARVQAGGPFDT